MFQTNSAVKQTEGLNRHSQEYSEFLVREPIRPRSVFPLFSGLGVNTCISRSLHVCNFFFLFCFHILWNLGKSFNLTSFNLILNCFVQCTNFSVFLRYNCARYDCLSDTSATRAFIFAQSLEKGWRNYSHLTSGSRTNGSFNNPYHKRMKVFLFKLNSRKITWTYVVRIRQRAPVPWCAPMGNAHFTLVMLKIDIKLLLLKRSLFNELPRLLNVTDC